MNDQRLSSSDMGIIWYTPTSWKAPESVEPRSAHWSCRIVGRWNERAVVKAAYELVRSVGPSILHAEVQVLNESPPEALTGEDLQTVLHVRILIAGSAFSAIHIRSFHAALLARLNSDMLWFQRRAGLISKSRAAALEYQTAEEHLAFWRRYVADGPATVCKAHRSLAVQGSDRWRHKWTLSSRVMQAIRVVAKRLEVCVTMVLGALFTWHVSYRLGLPRLSVGASAAYGDVDSLSLLNAPSIVPFEADISLEALVNGFKLICDLVVANAWLPMEFVIEELEQELGLAECEFFSMFVDYWASEARVDKYAGCVQVLEAEYPAFGAPLVISVHDQPDGTSLCQLSAARSCCGWDDVEAIASRFETLVLSTCEGGGTVSPAALMTPLEVNSLLASVPDKPDGRGASEKIGKAFHRLASDPVAARRIAIRLGEDELSYGELQAQALNIAAQLQAAGTCVGDVVGISIPRSFDLIASVLAVWTLGGVYLPLDPSLPAERLAYMIKDAGASFVLSRSDGGTPYIAHWPNKEIAGAALIFARNLERSSRQYSDEIAYIIYTSGSTGRPKGVVVPHRCVVNYLSFLVKNYGFGRDDNAINISTIGFDASIRDFFAPLSVGATITLVPSDAARDASVYLGLLASDGVTHILSITPTFLRLLCDTARDLPMKNSLSTVLVSGEVLPAALCRRVLRVFGSSVKIVNQYGPTECTMTSTWFPVKDVSSDHQIPVGMPIENVGIYILDGAQRPVPRGYVGEIYIGGAGVTEGYVDPKLNLDRFIECPWASSTVLYRTGDLGHWDSTGNLRYLGRTDQQVKVRGVRVELSEIETAIRGVTPVSEAVVVAIDDIQGDAKLVAFLVAAAPNVDFVELRKALLKVIPEYMVPSQFVVLQEFPLTASGKIDRQALHVPDGTSTVSTRQPRSQTEVKLCHLMAEILGSEVGVNDDFFLRGGHSLGAMRLLGRIKEEFDCSLTPLEVFQNSVVEELAALIDGFHAEAGVRRN